VVTRPNIDKSYFWGTLMGLAKEISECSGAGHVVFLTKEHQMTFKATLGTKKNNW
jgi:hypothetical protein